MAELRILRANTLVFTDPTDSSTGAIAYTPMMAADSADNGMLFVTNQEESGFRNIADIITDKKYDLIFEKTKYNFFPDTQHLEVEFWYDVTNP